VVRKTTPPTFVINTDIRPIYKGQTKSILTFSNKFLCLNSAFQLLPVCYFKISSTKLGYLVLGQEYSSLYLVKLNLSL